MRIVAKPQGVTCAHLAFRSCSLKTNAFGNATTPLPKT